MKFIEKLGKSVSRICMGGGAISGEGGGYGFGPIGEEESVELLRAAVELGVNIFDFAPIYGFNTAEKRAGKAFRELREKVLLVSKCGVSWGDGGRVNMSNDPKLALKMLDQSLANFQSDYIDIYMVHWPDPQVDIRHTVEALFNVREKGKIRHLGLCNSNPEELVLAQEVAPIEVLQSEANFFAQNTFKEMREIASAETLFMGWGTFDKGILTGSARPGRQFAKEDARSWAPWWKKSNWKERAEFAQSASRKFGLNSDELASSALAFSQTICDVSICGARRLEHLETTLKWLERENSGLEELACEFAAF